VLYEIWQRDLPPPQQVVFYTTFKLRLQDILHMHAHTNIHIDTHNLVPNHIKCTPNNYSISWNNIGFFYFISVQSVRSVTFTDLISVPQRERAIRKRVKLPSFNLTFWIY